MERVHERLLLLSQTCLSLAIIPYGPRPARVGGNVEAEQSDRVTFEYISVGVGLGLIGFEENLLYLARVDADGTNMFVSHDLHAGQHVARSGVPEAHFFQTLAKVNAFVAAGALRSFFIKPVSNPSVNANAKVVAKLLGHALLNIRPVVEDVLGKAVPALFDSPEVAVFGCLNGYLPNVKVLHFGLNPLFDLRFKVGETCSQIVRGIPSPS